MDDNIWIGIFIGVIMYFIPAITAYEKKKRNKQSILVINIFLGWTVIGWVVALAMAVGKDDEKQIIIHKETNSNNLQEIEKLSELKHKGIISEEEFQAKKKQLLQM